MKPPSPMKISIVLSILILAVGLTSGWFQRQQVVTLRSERAVLIAQARALGLDAGVSDSSGPGITKRQREEREKVSRSMGDEIVAFAKEMELREKDGTSEDSGFQKRSMEMLERLMALDAEQLETVIARLREDAGLSAETRESMMLFSVLVLGEAHPAAALALFAESADLLLDSDLAPHLIRSSLSRLAKEDPQAALRWIEKHGSEVPDLDGDDLKNGVLAGVAENDPARAFKLMGELGLAENSGAIDAIVSTATNPEQRAAILSACRDYLATIQEEGERGAFREEALAGLARTISGESFASLTAWMSSQKLSPAEIDQFVAGFSYDTTDAETGRWIDWMAQTLPAEKLDTRVGDLVGNWTQQDYLAAGKWLAAAADGPAKQAAVKSYAETVAGYEPQTAVQWALTLPAGEGRNSTLESIYQNWPSADAAGAKAFAAEHGIETEPTEEEP